MKYISKIFQPLIVSPRNVVSKSRDVSSNSQRLMVDLGVLRSTSSTGLFAMLPLGMRSLDKLTAIVHAKLKSLDALQISLPTLVSEDLWIKSQRLHVAGPEIMRMKDRHDRRYILSPTHEESITDLIASVSPLSGRQLPLRVYQISNKHRDEMRPRYGIIRSREFLMKDMYTFDMDKNLSMKTYESVSEAYEQIFSAIGIDYVKVEGCTGTIGGTISHEYHYPAPIGEDQLLECSSCSHRVSQEQLLNLNKVTEDDLSCSKCGDKNLKKTLGIEVGHTFLLGTKYSAALQAFTIGSTPLHMGCYGLGLSRILGAALESLSTETELRWPTSLVPFTVCIIGPKNGSKEDKTATPLIEDLYSTLTKSCPALHDDIIIDDRSHLTIGKRVLEARRFGYPYIVVIGQKACQEIPQYELLDLKMGISYLEKSELIIKIQDLTKTLKTFPNQNYMDTYSVSSDVLTENSLK